jgi:aspartyl/asparaginyl beta-hydroxylase (cupin superfamily)
MRLLNEFGIMFQAWRAKLSTDLLIRPAEFMIKRIDDREFFDSSEFPWAEEFAGHWQEIREELEVLLERLDDVPNFQDVSPHQSTLTSDDRWKTYIFCIHGNHCEENGARCPRTAELLKTIPGLKSAMFSILAPGKHITKHRGPYAGVLRYHLGLIVPKQKERCRIQVGSSVRHWEEGKSLIFDDSHDHEVWNDTNETRVVLFIDFVRPVPYPLSVWNAMIVRSLGWASMARIAVSNARKWNRALGSPAKRPRVTGPAGAGAGPAEGGRARQPPAG